MRVVPGERFGNLARILHVEVILLVTQMTQFTQQAGHFVLDTVDGVFILYRHTWMLETFWLPISRRCTVRIGITTTSSWSRPIMA